MLITGVVICSQGKQLLCNTNKCSRTIRPIDSYSPSYGYSLSLRRSARATFQNYEGESKQIDPLFRQLSERFFQVLERQGRVCPCTGILDRSHPDASLPHMSAASLKCAHILKRAVAVFPPSSSDNKKVRVRFVSSS